MKKIKLVNNFKGALQLRPNTGVDAEFLVLLAGQELVVDESMLVPYSSSLSIFVASGRLSFDEVKEKEVKEVKKKSEEKVQELVKEVKEEVISNDLEIAETKALIKEKTELFQKSTSKQEKLALKNEIADLKKKINALK